MTDDYNGWTNHATWNVALWIENDEGLYQLAKDCQHVSAPYRAFADTMREFNHIETPDRVAYNDRSLDTDALDEMIREL